MGAHDLAWADWELRQNEIGPQRFHTTHNGYTVVVTWVAPHYGTVSVLGSAGEVVDLSSTVRDAPRFGATKTQLEEQANYMLGLFDKAQEEA